MTREIKMDYLTIAFVVVGILALIAGGIVMHQDYREKHPKASH